MTTDLPADHVGIKKGQLGSFILVLGRTYCFSNDITSQIALYRLMHLWHDGIIVIIINYTGLVNVAAVNLVTFLHMCGSFCRIVHVASVTAPSQASDVLRFFDQEV